MPGRRVTRCNLLRAEKLLRPDSDRIRIGKSTMISEFCSRTQVAASIHREYSFLRSLYTFSCERSQAARSGSHIYTSRLSRKRFSDSTMHVAAGSQVQRVPQATLPHQLRSFTSVRPKSLRHYRVVARAQSDHAGALQLLFQTALPSTTAFPGQCIVECLLPMRFQELRQVQL